MAGARIARMQGKACERRACGRGTFGDRPPICAVRLPTACHAISAGRRDRLVSRHAGDRHRQPVFRVDRGCCDPERHRAASPHRQGRIVREVRDIGGHRVAAIGERCRSRRSRSPTRHCPGPRLCAVDDGFRAVEDAHRDDLTVLGIGRGAADGEARGRRRGGDDVVSGDRADADCSAASCRSAGCRPDCRWWRPRDWRCFPTHPGSSPRSS